MESGIMLSQRLRGSGRRLLVWGLCRYWKLFALCLVLLLISAGLTASKAWLVRPAVDAFASGEADARGLWLIGLAIVLAFALQGAVSAARTILSKRLSMSIAFDLRAIFFDHLMGQSLRYFHDRASGDLASRFVNDVGTFETAALNAVQGLFRDLASLVFLLALMATYDVRLAAIGFAVLAVLALILFAADRHVRRISMRIQQAIAAMAGRIAETVNGIEVALSFGFGGKWRERFGETNASLKESRIALHASTAVVETAVQFVLGLAIATIFVFAGSAVIAGDLTTGEFAALVVTMYLMHAPAASLAQRFVRLSEGLAAGERALGLLEDHDPLPEPVDPLSPDPARPRITVRDVSFAHDGNPVLSSASLDIAPGELAAVVGPSGSGKTTLARLILRLYDADAGEVLVGGAPVGRIPRGELYRYVTYVPQEPQIFEGTIAENLLVAHPDATPDELWSVLRRVCLEDFVRSLPQGLHTPVGERGAKLSGGERQRLAIARALLSEARVLILDEVTSALDPPLEAEVIANLSGEKKTILAITHRPSIRACASRTWEMRSGRLQEWNGTSP